MGPSEMALATAVDQLPEGGDYVFQPKFDGWRGLLSTVDDGSVTMRSRSGRRLDAYFPDLRRAARGWLPAGTVLDGEVIAWSAAGTTDFSALQRRLVAGRNLPALAARWPAYLIAFDVLADAGQDVRAEPLTHRLARLAGLLDGAPDRLVLCPSTRDVTEALAWTTTMAALRVEGLVAKPATGRYRSGRSGWLKWRLRHTTEAIIGGVTGSRTQPETLLLGRYDATGKLRLIGRTTPLNPALAAEIGRLLQAPTAGRQRVQHPWPQPLPAGWLGRWDGRAEPLAYHQVDAATVVEIYVDTAEDAGRWRHPVTAVRPRLDMSVFAVPMIREEPD
jgi:ATP-dependent DNA ligase